MTHMGVVMILCDELRKEVAPRRDTLPRRMTWDDAPATGKRTIVYGGWLSSAAVPLCKAARSSAMVPTVLTANLTAVASGPVGGALSVDESTSVSAKMAASGAASCWRVRAGGQAAA